MRNLTRAALGLGLNAPEGRPGPSRGLTESNEFWGFFLHSLFIFNIYVIFIIEDTVFVVVVEDWVVVVVIVDDEDTFFGVVLNEEDFVVVLAVALEDRVVADIFVFAVVYEDFVVVLVLEDTCRGMPELPFMDMWKSFGGGLWDLRGL